MTTRPLLPQPARHQDVPDRSCPSEDPGHTEAVYISQVHRRESVDRDRRPQTGNILNLYFPYQINQLYVVVILSLYY